MFSRVVENDPRREMQGATEPEADRERRGGTDREQALKEHAAGTNILREFAGTDGNKERHLS